MKGLPVNTTLTSSEIIMKLGVKEYRCWLYLKERDFKRPHIDEMVRDLGAHEKTIRTWIKKLEKYKCI